MLNEFVKHGVDKGFFEIKMIKDIPDSECKSSEIEVIDFDKVKKAMMPLFKQFGYKEFKSCDCLKIINDYNRIDFIEIKGLRKYIEFFRVSKKLHRPERQIEKFGIDFKLHDSFILFQLLAHLFIEELGIKKVEQLKTLNHVYIVLTDIDLKNNSRNRYTATMNYLANRDSTNYFIKMERELKEHIDVKLEKCSTIAIERRLFCQEELADYYKNFEKD